jgi:hypothetical protein
LAACSLAASKPAKQAEENKDLLSGEKLAHQSTLSLFIAIRRSPEKRHKSVAGACVTARDLLAYSSLHHLLGLARISKESVRSTSAGADLLRAPDLAHK